MSHTQGPLRLCDERDTDFAGACVVDANGYLIGDFNIFGFSPNAPSEATCLANARLFAAGPDLLGACESALDEVAELLGESTALIRILKSAIAKAKGEEPRA